MESDMLMTWHTGIRTEMACGGIKMLVSVTGERNEHARSAAKSSPSKARSRSTSRGFTVRDPVLIGQRRSAVVYAENWREAGTSTARVTNSFSSVRAAREDESTCSNTARSWPNISAARSRRKNRCTTRTATDWITASRILSCVSATTELGQRRLTAPPVLASPDLGRTSGLFYA